MCLHSYNDTVNANAGVIIKYCFRLLRGKFQVVLPFYRAMHFAVTRHSLSQKAIPYVQISFTRYRRRTAV